MDFATKCETLDKRINISIRHQERLQIKLSNIIFVPIEKAIRFGIEFDISLLEHDEEVYQW